MSSSSVGGTHTTEVTGGHGPGETEVTGGQSPGETEVIGGQSPGETEVIGGQSPGETEVTGGQSPGETEVTGGQSPGETEVTGGQSPGETEPRCPLNGRTEAQILKGILDHMKVELGKSDLQVQGIDIKRLAPFREVQNLMWIKKNAVHSAALEEWDRKEKLLSSRVDKKEKRSGSLKNEIYQLVGFFSVFQGVVLTAVTQLTQVQDQSHAYVCKKVWSPVLLTTLAWVVATVGVWQKLSRIETLECEREDEDQARREVVRRANALRREGEQFKFIEFKVEDLSKRVAPKAFLEYRIWHFWINRFGIVFASLSVFTGIFIASYFLILCSRGLAPIG